MASPKKIGIPWPELNDGLSYDDVVRPSDAGFTLIEFYSTEYKGRWLQRIKSDQITVDAKVVTDPDTILRGYTRPSKPVPGDCGYYLHAHRLFLSHPITNKVIEIIAPLLSILQIHEEAIGQQTTA